ncbi:MAG TPA: PqqD family protein [Gaiellaceae bacterium]|nr:PqqD family protein [Gaiellaceae bacterium]
MTVRLRDKDLSWRILDGEVVALDTAGSVYLGANASGAQLWKLLAAGAERDELADALVTTYGLEREAAERDVDRFLAELRGAGLLVDEA